MAKNLSTFEREMASDSFKAEFKKQFEELLISELIVDMMEKEGKSVRELSVDTGISSNSINKIRTGKQEDVKLRNFLSITRACGYSLSLERGNVKIKLEEVISNKKASGAC